MAKTNTKICIKTRDGSIQTISLYSEKSDVLKNGETNYLVVREGRGNWGGLAALGDLNHPKASKLRYGNKAILMEVSTKKIIDLSDKYKMSDLYPSIYNTMEHIPDEENTEFVTGDRNSLESMFNSCLKLTTVPLFNTSNITNMEQMFCNCYNLTTISLFDTSRVTNMEQIFYNCRKLTSVPLFNTSSVTNMEAMFANCRNLISVPLFNTSGATNMKWMFSGCFNLTTVPTFNTSNVTNMETMFSGCFNLTTVPTFNIRNVERINNILYGTKVTSVTFRNKPANLEINSEILCGDPNQIKTINFI